MFPNCIDRFSRQKKKETTQQKTNKENPRKKLINKKMGIIVPTMNHYPRNG